MQYPVKALKEWAEYPQLSALQKITIWWRDVRRRRAVKDRLGSAKMTLVSGRGPSGFKAGVPLILCVRNGIAHLPLFFKHYRSLGIERFIVVDDGSTDGSRQWLENRHDVDLYVSNLGYTEAIRGALWRDALITLYGKNRWYVSVDVDEFLLFPGSETRHIDAYCEDLERGGRARGMAPMLDTYPDGPLSSGGMNNAITLSQVAPLIDGTGYQAFKRKYCVSINGGPRNRLYGNEIRLTKFPVIYADECTSYAGASIHSPFPLLRNYQPVSSVLLHLKFTAESVEEFKKFVLEGRHFGGAQFYRQIIENEEFGDSADLRYDGSMQWLNSENLVNSGFMIDLRK